MQIRNLFVSAMCGLLPLASYGQVSNDNEDGVYKVDRHGQQAFRPGELIVKFKSDGAVRRMAPGKFKTSAVSAVDRLFAELGVEEVEPLMPLTGELKAGAPRKVKAFNGKDVEIMDLSKLYTLRLDTTKQINVFKAIEQLKTLDEVEFAEPNYLVYVQGEDDGPEFDDPLYAEQENLREVNLPQLWEMPKITDKRPVIAILDTGVDITHPDLADNIWTNPNEAKGQEGYDDDNNGFADDVHGWDFVLQSPNLRDRNGHGTHCAGIAAAVGNNGIGIVGANPDALIMPIAVMQSDGTGDIATIIKGVDYAAANGADVLSMSFGTYQYSIAMDQALGHAYADAVLVAAAGNDGRCIYKNHHQMGPGPMLPAAFTYVLGVQAKDARFSNWDCDGPTFSNYGEEKLYNYEISAPGTQIMSTFPQGKYKVLSGTSMACPLVAGAVSRLYQCKEIGSKEMLLGDLIHTSQGFYTNRSVSMLDVLATYNIKDEDRTPELEFIGFEMTDTDGDADGRYDAGEVVEIYPTIRNLWGHAENVRYSIELANELEDLDFVEFLVPEAALGRDLDGYAKAKSVNPLRIRLSDKCVDGLHLQFRIKGTCDNSALDFSQEYTISVENGVELGGLITHDMTLYPDKNYIVTRSLGVPEGVTLTIKPGTVLKFKDDTGLSSSGHIKAIGSPDSLIIFKRAEFSNGELECFSFDQDNFEYCVFEGLGTQFQGQPGIDNYGRPYLNYFFKHCIFRNCDGLTLLRLNLSKCCVYENKIYTLNANWYKNVQEYVNIVGNICWREGSLYDIDKYNYSNSLDNEYGSEAINYYLRSSSPYVDTSNLYLGSANETIARRGIYDMLHPTAAEGYGMVDFETLAKRPYAESHGIVWKVVVNGKDAQDEFDELPPLGVGKHKFEVYFNRPMEKSVVPTISMGIRPPYTQTAIAEDGEWNEDGTVYTAYLNIAGRSDYDGLNRIRVYGAQDDEHFEIPEEHHRFNVMVQKAGSMSTGLIAEEGLGKVKLTWETDEESFADLMGYNVYRFEDHKDDSNEEMRDMWDELGNWYQEKGHWNEYGEWVKFVAQDTIMINTSLIDPNETEFIDYDVTPGKTYYYLVREIGTDLQQHDVSNVVAATPKTSTLGDANGSGDVDVADVITTVNFAAGQDPKPFIFEAADMNADASIDILDVIGIIKKIVNPQAQAAAMAESTAMYTIEDGVVYVESPVALAGVQVRLLMPEKRDITPAADMKSMESTGAWLSDNDYIFLGYNMVGKTLEPGKHAILNIGDAQLTDIRLSDAFGHNVNAESSTVTKIDHMGHNVMNINGVYSLSGVRISGDSGKELPKGVYIINGKKVVM